MQTQYMQFLAALRQAQRFLDANKASLGGINVGTTESLLYVVNLLGELTRGRAWISAASLPEGPVLRACITHDESSESDIEVLCEELELARGA